MERAGQKPFAATFGQLLNAELELFTSLVIKLPTRRKRRSRIKYTHPPMNNTRAPIIKERKRAAVSRNLLLYANNVMKSNTDILTTISSYIIKMKGVGSF